MSIVFQIVLPVFAVLAFGYGAVWRGFFSREAIQGLMRFSQNFAIPILLFTAISTLDLHSGFEPDLLISYYTGSTVSFILGTLGARLMFGRNWPESVAIGFCALFANSLLLGISITERAFGSDALGPNYAIVAVHAPFCYFLGITTMEIARAPKQSIILTAIRVTKGMFKNSLMLAIGLGFVFNILGLGLPQPISEAFSLVTQAALPTALFALGGVLYFYRPTGSQKEVLMVCLLSLIVHPALVFGLGTQVFHLPVPLLQSAVLTAAMAPGVNAFLFANLYDTAKSIAATAVLVGTAGSILTVPFWLFFLKAL